VTQWFDHWYSWSSDKCHHRMSHQGPAFKIMLLCNARWRFVSRDRGQIFWVNTFPIPHYSIKAPWKCKGSHIAIPLIIFLETITCVKPWPTPTSPLYISDASPSSPTLAWSSLLQPSMRRRSNGICDTLYPDIYINK